MNDSRHKYVFGPVPSRRLGRSLGVDLVPFKTCPFDCVYCQLGRTTLHTARREEYASTDQVLAELAEVLGRRPECDYVTLSGSGEPTLHRDLDRIVSAVKDLTDVPLAVLTNAALLGDPDVRRALLPADLVVPSLDAGDEETFARVNRPCPPITFPSLVDGLTAFRGEYTGRIDLEILLVAGLNDSDEQIEKIKALAARIRPDGIDLNTVTRPPAEADARPVGPERLSRIAEILGPSARIIAPHTPGDDRSGPVDRQELLGLLRRRPCTLDDLMAALRCHRWEAAKLLGQLTEEGVIAVRRHEDTMYYEVRKKDE